MLGMVDIVMVGHLGDSAVASVGISNRIQFVVLVIVTGLSWAVGVLSAQYFGAGKSERIRQLILISSTLGIMSLITISGLSAVYIYDFMGLVTADVNVIEIGANYLLITMPSLIFVCLIMVFEGALRSTNQVILPMAFSAAAIFINAGLNYWLINGGLGIDAMGVEGAAWATLIARTIHILSLLYFLYKIKHFIFPHKSDFSKLNVKADWLKVIRLVWPMMFGFGLWALGTFVYQLIYSHIGTRELSVISLLTPIEGIFIATFFGFASACSIIVGQNLGANKFDDAWRIAKLFSIVSPFITLVIGGLLLLSKDFIFYPYQSMPAETLDLAREIFIIIALGATIKIYNMIVALGSLRAGGDNNYCLLIDTVALWLISIPLTYYVAFHLKLPLFWVVMAAFSEEIVKVILFTWRMHRKHWLKNLS
jgi:putative MATE family efflux protein